MRTGLLDANLALRAAALVAPPVILGQPQNASAIEGQTATFSVDAAGAPMSYQWRRNDVPIAGAVQASHTTPALTIAADNGATYSVVITNGANGGSTATSASATLAVAAPPPPPPAGAPPPTGGGGGGGASPLWQLLLLAALMLGARIRSREQ